MKIKHQMLVLVCLCTLSACTHKTWTITSRSSKKIPVDATTEALADKAYQQQLAPYKEKVDAKMNRVIGQAAENMRGHAPESLLSNLSADIYLQSASAFAGQKVDIAVVNLGGLRTEVPAGTITVRKVFELMPFENELVILWLKGDLLHALLDQFAREGGQGVAGLRMTIRDKKATEITINGQALDENRLYSIATNDYLAGGNDRMVQLAQAEKRVNTGVKVRNMLLNYIETETSKGNPIRSALDGRIRIAQ